MHVFNQANRKQQFIKMHYAETKAQGSEFEALPPI